MGDAAQGRLAARPGPDGSAGALRALPAGRHELVVGYGQVAVLDVPAPVPGSPPGARPPLLVMLHGATVGPEHSLEVLGSAASSRGVVVLAPSSVGISWDVIEGGYGPDVEALDEALALTFEAVAVDPDRVLLGGFSDGASYALSLGLANGDLCSAVLAFSPGFIAPPVVVGRPRVFVAHGLRDRILPIAATSHLLVPQLRQAGYEVRFDEHERGHSVPSAVVEAALDWALAARPPAGPGSG